MPDRALLQELLWCRDEGETAPVPIREPAKSPTAGICGGRRDKEDSRRRSAGAAGRSGNRPGPGRPRRRIFLGGSDAGWPSHAATPSTTSSAPAPGTKAPRRTTSIETGEALVRRWECGQCRSVAHRYRISRRASWADPFGEMVTQSASETLSLREIIGIKQNA